MEKLDIMNRQVKNRIWLRLLLLTGCLMLLLTGAALAEKDVNLTFEGGGTSTTGLVDKYETHEFTLEYTAEVCIEVKNTSTHSNGLWSEQRPVIRLENLSSEDVSVPSFNKASQSTGTTKEYELVLLPGHYKLKMMHRYFGKYEVNITGIYLPSVAPVTVDLDTGISYTLDVWNNGLAYEWVTSDENVAVVDEDDDVTGLRGGTATITCLFSDGTKSTVTVNVAQGEMNPERACLVPQQQVRLSLDHVQGDVIWSSSDEKIATVDSTGTVTGIRPGKVTIKATKYQTDYKCDVTVYSVLNGGEVQNLLGKNLLEVNQRLERKLKKLEPGAYTNDYFLLEADEDTYEITSVSLLTDAEYGIGSFTLFGTYPGMNYNEALTVLANYGWVYSKTFREYIYFSNSMLKTKELVVTLINNQLDLISYYGDTTEADRAGGVFGLNLDADGVWRYYEDGVFVRRTGVAEYNGGQFYIIDGVLSYGANGLYLIDGRWVLCSGGMILKDYTGLYCDANLGWWLIRDGAVDFSYTGLYCDANVGWWLLGGGTIAWDYSGLWNNPDTGWWLIRNGTIAWDYTGLWNDPKYGWWLIGSGHLAEDYTGLWNDPVYGWWLIGNGQIRWDYTGLWNDPTLGWWLIGGGAIARDYNGLWNDSNYGTWMIRNGTIDWSYSGN